MNIFVGNLSFNAAEADVRRLFENFGNVTLAVIVKNKKGLKSRGFGFVEMPDEQQAKAAITALEGKEFMGRRLKVGSARSKSEMTREQEKKTRFNSASKRKSNYKKGRRSRSFMKNKRSPQNAGDERPKSVYSAD